MNKKWMQAICTVGVSAICAISSVVLPTIHAVAATYSAWFTDKAEVTDYAYSFAVVGDPQYITQKYPVHLPKIYDWILENQEEKNIQHVFGLGDITHTDSDSEWGHAKKAITKMDGKISYSLVRGNHDSTIQMSRNFWYEGYTSQFGGFYKNGDISTSWKTLSVGETDYLLVTLDYGATDEELAWASEVVESYPEHKVIVTTHAYLSAYGKILTENDNDRPKYEADKNRDPEKVYNSGADIWDNFISIHPNIFLVMCGHVLSNDIQTLQSVGAHGNTITQVMINPQKMDNDDTLGPTGMVAMLYFKEDGSSFEVEWYSTIKQQFWKSKNQFTVSLPDRTIPQHVYNQQVTTDAYLKTPATHLEQAEYYYSCQCGWKCEETFRAGEKVGAHTWEDIVGDQYLHTAATCTTGGIYYKSCKCGEISKLIFQTNSLGHDWEGNCEERHCVREDCGVSAPTNHKWNDGEVTIEPQVGVAGEKTYTCTKGNCNATKTEEIPALLPPEDSSSSEEIVDSSSSEEIVDSSSQTDSAPVGGGLSCSGSVTGVAGLFGVISAAAFVLLKKKEN